MVDLIGILLQIICTKQCSLASATISAPTYPGRMGRPDGPKAQRPSLGTVCRVEIPHWPRTSSCAAQEAPLSLLWALCQEHLRRLGDASAQPGRSLVSPTTLLAPGGRWPLKRWPLPSKNCPVWPSLALLPNASEMADNSRECGIKC